MSSDAARTNVIYGLIQTVLLCAFALAFVADISPPLFESNMLRTAGGFLCAGSILLMVSALVSIRGSIQIAPAPRDDAELVTRGVYAWFRHPIYTAIVVLLVGLFLREPTIAVAIAAVLVTTYLVVKVRIEEQLLLARYPEYAAYKTRTFGLLPWFSRSR